MVRSSRHHGNLAVLGALVLGLTLSGCLPVMQQRSRSNEASRMQIVPYSAQYAVALEARDIVAIMRAANFNDQQIYEYGPQLRNALMTVGGAQVQIHSAKETKIAVLFEIREDDYVLVSSAASGYFVYDARKHAFGLRDSSQNTQPPPPTAVPQQPTGSAPGIPAGYAPQYTPLQTVQPQQ